MAARITSITRPTADLTKFADTVNTAAKTQKVNNQTIFVDRFPWSCYITLVDSSTQSVGTLKYESLCVLIPAGKTLKCQRLRVALESSALAYVTSINGYINVIGGSSLTIDSGNQDASSSYVLYQNTTQNSILVTVQLGYKITKTLSVGGTNEYVGFFWADLLIL